MAYKNNVITENSTKYKFMIEALKLFSEKGYKAVTVAEIAEAVGCSAPALYKHYKNKQELLRAIIDTSNMDFARRMNHYELSSKEQIIAMTVEDHMEKVKQLVGFAMHDEFATAFRKLCAVEQFHIKELADIYTYRYCDFQIQYCEKVMRVLIEGGVIRETDPLVMAKLYMSYPILTITLFEREPDREEELMNSIEDHVREFFRAYKK